MSSDAAPRRPRQDHRHRVTPQVRRSDAHGRRDGGTGISMRHFRHLTPERRSALFHREPAEFTSEADAGTLAVALGATLYSPATRPALAGDVLKQAARGVVSMVLCLEDSIADAEVPLAEANLVGQLRELAGGPGRAGRVAVAVRPGAGVRADHRPGAQAGSGGGAAVGFRAAQVHRGPFGAVPGGAHRGGGGLRAAAVRDARPGVARAAAPGDPHGRARRDRSPPWRSTASGSSRCGWASPTSAPPTGCGARRR